MRIHPSSLIAAMLIPFGAHADDAPDSAVSETIVISATRFSQPLAELPPYAQVITRSQIERSPARTLPELLARMGNVGGPDLFGNNSTLTTVDLGGFGAAAAQNTLILVDGRRVSDIDLSGVNWSALPLSGVERVEILRGGGAVLYGDGASAGVINIITRSPGAEGTSARAAAGVASLNTWHAQTEAALSAGPVGLGMLANHYDSAGYRKNNRNQQSVVQGDLRWSHESLRARLNVIGDHQRLRLPGARLVDRNTGTDLLTTDRRGTATPLDYSARDGLQANIDLDTRWQGGDAALGLGYREKDQTSYFDFGGFPDYRDVTLSVWSLNPRTRFTNRWGDSRNDLVVGADLYRWDYDLALTSSPAFVTQPVHRVHGDQSNFSLYVLDTLRPGPLTTLSLGARAERFRIDADDRYDASAPDPTFIGGTSSTGYQRETQYAWEAGVLQRFTTHYSLGVRTTRSYRFATIDEIYETSASFSREFQFLRPQTNRGYELSQELAWADVSFTGTVYRLDVRDEIHLDPFTSGVGNTNLPPTRREGVNLGVQWAGGDTLDLVGTYTYTRARFRSGFLPGSGFTRSASLAGKSVPLVPRHKASLAFNWRPRTDLSLATAWSYVGAQFMENDEDNTLGERIPAYAVLDFKARYAHRRFAVDAFVNNITDRKYFNYAVSSQFTAGRYNAYPLPGRTVGLNLELPLF